MATMPTNVTEAYDPTMRIRPSVEEAVRVFAASKPYSGSTDERCSKFRSLHTLLCGIYNTPIGLSFYPPFGGGPGSSRAEVGSTWGGSTTITLSGKLSVISYLRAFAQALGRNERSARRFAVNLFARHFPQEWGKVTIQGHTVTSTGPRCRPLYA